MWGGKFLCNKYYVVVGMAQKVALCVDDDENLDCCASIGNLCRNNYLICSCSRWGVSYNTVIFLLTQN
jgi:hypothetical protein